MKMKVIDRVIMAVFAALAVLALIAVCLCFMAPVSGVNLESLSWMRPVSWLLMLGLLAWLVRLVVLQFRHDGGVPRNTTAVKDTEEGAVRVSLRAMDTLVRRAIAQTEGILDSKQRIINHDDSVTVEIDMIVGSDTHVPATTAILQRNVKGIIEEFAGIAVQEVVVVVTEIRDTAPPALPVPEGEGVQAVVVEAEKVEVKAEEPAESAEAECEAEEAAEECAEAECEAEEPAEECVEAEEAACESAEAECEAEETVCESAEAGCEPEEVVCESAEIEEAEKPIEA